MSFRKALNIFELQEIARRRLPRGVFGFVEGGVEDNVARDNNRAVFDRIRFRPRQPVDVAQRSQEVELFARDGLRAVRRCGLFGHAPRMARLGQSSARFAPDPAKARENRRASKRA